MKCEGCNAEAPGFVLFDYCEACGKNLCPTCMGRETCSETTTRIHKPSEENAEPREQCSDCGAEVLGYHQCQGRP